jgi:hypothetical protein
MCSSSADTRSPMVSLMARNRIPVVTATHATTEVAPLFRTGAVW